MPIITKEEPTDNPSGALILYENLLIAEDMGGNRANALTPTTFDRWTDVAGDMIASFQLSTPTFINSIGIAAHNLAGKNTRFTIQTAETIDGARIDHASIIPINNEPILITFKPTLAAEIRIEGLLIGSAIPREIGVVYAGNTLQMPRNIYGGHSPITLSQKTEYQSVKSESGQILGKTIIRKGLETAFSWQFLDDRFYRDEFQSFVESARTTPFFIKWRPDFYSEEVAYGETNQDIQPSNMGGGHRLMSVGLTMTAHADL